MTRKQKDQEMSEDNEIVNSTAAVVPAATRTVAVAKVEFTVPAPYVPGEIVLTRGEAEALNAALASAYRNAVARKASDLAMSPEGPGVELKDLQESGRTDEVASLVSEAVAFVFSLPEDEKPSLNSRKLTDPLQQTIRDIINELLDVERRKMQLSRAEFVKSLNTTWSDLVAKNMDNPAIVEAARKRLEETKALATLAL